tara:strand:+ start:519 stop:1295 length:777 start_codon:yes stop_codon:yes gene_type:complete
MATMTLLQMTQDILSDMDSDNVNAINDSVEALQVAQIIKTSYFNIINGKDYDFLHKLFQLTASTTVDRPTHMKVPGDIINVEYVKYNCKLTAPARDLFKVMEYKTPEEFMDLVDARDSLATNVKVVSDLTGVTLNILKDKAPSCYTSFNDDEVIFDAYIATLETNLQASKTQSHGKRAMVFTMSDTFIPDLPVQMFTYLLNEAKSACFLTLKQMANPKAEQISTRQRRIMSEEAFKIKKGISFPNYGRNVANKRTPNY